MRCYSPKFSSLPLVFRRGAGEYFPPLRWPTSQPPCSIVEFASQEDAQRSVRELSEQILLSRPVFIREVSPHFWDQLEWSLIAASGPRE